ncbi:MAG: hypothetical protein H0T42_18530 [Deltaproteobacteria bacterium]|nr:hypothetical protein [Deltaproteobacteria bacterium]
MTVAVLAMAVALVIALSWRHPWAPAVGAMVGVVVAIATGAANRADVEHALHDLWRPMLGIVGIMTTTACAAELGIFTRLAAWIEPSTRGPVRHAFRFVFVVAALTSAILSNDAAILLLTPVVIELLRTVYPKRNPKFVVPFAFATFVAAGVAPLPTGNPMNLVVAYRAGIDFNTYAAHMIPVAIVGWVVAYLALAWWYRDVLSDEAPALGGAPPRALPLSGHAKVVLAVTFASIAAYPILAALRSVPRSPRPAKSERVSRSRCTAASRPARSGRASAGSSSHFCSECSCSRPPWPAPARPRSSPSSTPPRPAR